MSILIAAYFAVCDEEHANEDGAIWGLNPNILSLHEVERANLSIAWPNDQEGGVFGPDNSITTNLISGPFPPHLGYEEISVPILSTKNTARSRAQHSEFTIHGDRIPLEERYGPETGVLLKICVPGIHKQGIRNELSQVGFNRAYLFPDLDNLAAELLYIRSRYTARNSRSH